MEATCLADENHLAGQGVVEGNADGDAGLAEDVGEAPSEEGRCTGVGANLADLKVEADGRGREGSESTEGAVAVGECNAGRVASGGLGERLIFAGDHDGTGASVVEVPHLGHGTLLELRTHVANEDCIRTERVDGAAVEAEEANGAVAVDVRVARLETGRDRSDGRVEAKLSKDVVGNVLNGDREVRGTHGSGLEVGRCGGIDDGRRHCQAEGGTTDGVAGDGHADNTICAVDVGKDVAVLDDLRLVAVEVNERGVDNSGCSEHNGETDPVNGGDERLNTSAVRHVGDEEVLGACDVVDIDNGNVLGTGERGRGGTGDRVGRLGGDEAEIDLTTGTRTGCGHTCHEVMSEVGVLGTSGHADSSGQDEHSGAGWASCDGEAVLVVGSARDDTLNGVAGVVDVVEDGAVVSEREEADGARVLDASCDQGLLVVVETIGSAAVLGTNDGAGEDGSGAGPHLHGALDVAAVGSEVLVGVEALVGVHLVEINRHAGPGRGVVVVVRKVDDIAGGLEVTHRLPVVVVVVPVDAVRDGGVAWEVGESSFKRGHLDAVDEVVQIVNVVLQMVDVVVR